MKNPKPKKGICLMKRYFELTKLGFVATILTFSSFVASNVSAAEPQNCPPRWERSCGACVDNDCGDCGDFSFHFDLLVWQAVQDGVPFGVSIEQRGVDPLTVELPLACRSSSVHAFLTGTVEELKFDWNAGVRI